MNNQTVSRREFLRWGTAGLAAATLPRSLWAAASGVTGKDRPNIVIVLADDMGWRDTGYQGSPHAKTPHLDDMAGKGVRFDYFYPAQQMCSPGRFGILTGRAPFRVGLHALGAMRPQEITVAKALKTIGYRTGHFGKWHLGGKETHPVRMGFDKSFYSANYFDLGGKLAVDDTKESVPVKGDSSVFTMDLALDWIRQQATAKQPFFAYVCFGSPHGPHEGAEEFKALYKGTGGKVDFLAEVSGVDAAVGNLRRTLRELGVADNTLVWFMSDNGGITPDSMDPSGKGKMRIGVRTVACLEWPARIPKPLRTDCACVHMDCYPTILDAVGVQMPNQPVVDGTSLLPLFDGQMQRRPKPMGFMSWGGKGKEKGGLGQADFVKDTGAVWIDGQYKLVLDRGESPRLYDIYPDPKERTDIAGNHAEQVAKMQRDLDAWRVSVRASFDGKDYKK
jgi:arylsulfatase A-like enzyme